MGLLGRRAAWKGPFFKPFNLQKGNQAMTEMRTYARNTVILPTFVGHTFHVYNGQKFLPVRVSEQMVFVNAHEIIVDWASIGRIQFQQKSCRVQRGVWKQINLY
jgi:small subunit ribosomal protein S19